MQLEVGIGSKQKEDGSGVLGPRSQRLAAMLAVLSCLMTKAEEAHKAIVASLGCVICRDDGYGICSAEVHHIAEGSGKRSDFMTAGLCKMHHREPGTGLHGMGVKAFLMRHGLPTEYHLLELVNKFRAEDGV
tara:strand:- start:2474 stop:2869 length:396 start_codon:yes stop_codon:yes gene_type:complete